MKELSIKIPVFFKQEDELSEDERRLLAEAKAGTQTACGHFLLVKKVTCPKRIHESKCLDSNDKQWILTKEK